LRRGSIHEYLFGVFYAVFLGKKRHFKCKNFINKLIASVEKKNCAIFSFITEINLGSRLRNLDDKNKFSSPRNT
jgi:hypothetical protein